MYTRPRVRGRAGGYFVNVHLVDMWISAAAEVPIGLKVTGNSQFPSGWFSSSQSATTKMKSPLGEHLHKSDATPPPPGESFITHFGGCLSCALQSTSVGSLPPLKRTLAKFSSQQVHTIKLCRLQHSFTINMRDRLTDYMLRVKTSSKGTPQVAQHDRGASVHSSDGALKA